MTAMELFDLVDAARDDRGWGRSLRTRVAAWYVERPVAEVAADMLRCPGRNGYTHRDLLRLSHPKPDSAARNALFQWAVEGSLGHLATPEISAGELRQVYAVERLKTVNDEREAVGIVEQFSLEPDMLPAEWKHSRAIWESLIERMSCAELVQFLPHLADFGLLSDESATTALAVARLMDRRGVLASGLASAEVERARDAYMKHPRATLVITQALADCAALLTASHAPASADFNTASVT